MNASKLLAADVAAPITTSQITPALPDGNNNWYTVPVQLIFTATDLESGVAQIMYKLDNNSWQVINFTDTLNLAPNPSFENYSATSSAKVQSWAATTTDSSTIHSQDQDVALTGFEISSAKIATTGTGWHGINHSGNFSIASPYANMSASVWVKTENVTGTTQFKVYAVSPDAESQPTVFTQISQSSTLTGTNDWTQISLNFVVNVDNAVGVYIDLGLNGPGTVWFDAITITDSVSSAQTTFTVGADGVHTVSFYSIDRANNTETYSCTGTIKNCVNFQIDQVPPGNWHDSGAFRDPNDSSHVLYVFTTVEDPTSGVSTLSDKYQYLTDFNPEFGSYSNISACNSTWQIDQYVSLAPPSYSSGDNSAYLITQKTDFCNNDWKTCKIVKFYTEDVAGNSVTKDYCINGPWIQFNGKGIVRANGGIDMISEPPSTNTDGLVEVGNSLISFFTSTNNLRLFNSPQPTNYDYDKFLETVTATPTNINALNTQSGVFLIDSDFEIINATLPGDYDSATFNQIVFVNGNLRISDDIELSGSSTALFIVKGNVEIARDVEVINIAIAADGDFYTAYDASVGQASRTLNLSGFYSANKFYFQRTLQGTNNSVTPTEYFTYEPKYLLELRDYLGENSVSWSKVD